MGFLTCTIHGWSYSEWKGWFPCEIWTLHNFKCTILATKPHISTLTHQTQGLDAKNGIGRNYSIPFMTPFQVAPLTYCSLQSMAITSFTFHLLPIPFYSSSSVLPLYCSSLSYTISLIPLLFQFFLFFPFGKGAILDKGNSLLTHHLHLRSWICFMKNKHLLQQIFMSYSWPWTSSEPLEVPLLVILIAFFFFNF